MGTGQHAIGCSHSRFKTYGALSTQRSLSPCCTRIARCVCVFHVPFNAIFADKRPVCISQLRPVVDPRMSSLVWSCCRIFVLELGREQLEDGRGLVDGVDESSGQERVLRPQAEHVRHVVTVAVQPQLQPQRLTRIYRRYAAQAASAAGSVPLFEGVDVIFNGVNQCARFL